MSPLSADFGGIGSSNGGCITIPVISKGIMLFDSQLLDPLLRSVGVLAPVITVLGLLFPHFDIGNSLIPFVLVPLFSFCLPLGFFPCLIAYHSTSSSGAGVLSHWASSNLG